MRTAFLSGLILISGLALLGGCSSDSPSPVTSCDATCAENQEIAEFVVTNNCYWLPSDQNILNQNYLIYIDGKVTDTKGNEIGTFDSATGTMTLNDGTTVENIDLSTLTELTPEKVQEIKDAVEDAKNNGGENQGNSSNSGNGTEQGQSNATVGSSGSDTSAPAESSSSFGKVQGGVMDVSGYPVPTLKNISGNGTRGWNTRYWDACKPHCARLKAKADDGRPDTTSEATYSVLGPVARNCNINDVEIPAFTLSNTVDKYWMGYKDTGNACVDAEGGENAAFTCTDMAPIAVNDTLAYAFVASQPGVVNCGECFHLQYDGGFNDQSDNNKPKATHLALKNKHLIVMTSNIGTDVKNGQFDLMVPGGGVGIFDALTKQVKGNNINWGAQYGGFLTLCQENSNCGYDGTLDCYQSCIREKCDEAFSNHPNLLRGCKWFADWYMAADNPTYQWEKIECPQYLEDKYYTTINTTKATNIKWQDDWSTYNDGSFETKTCWSAGQDPEDPNNPNAGCR